MKTKINFLVLLAIIFIGQPLNLWSQWNWAPTPNFSKFAQTNVGGAGGINTIRSVGIGDFTGNGASTNSFLHVNSNFLPLPLNGTIATSGEVFRTDCPMGDVPFWRMFKGGIERARFYVPGGGSSSENFIIETAQPGSNLLFNTQSQTGNTTRMFISDGVSFPLTSGFIGMGTNFTNPLSLLHIDATLNNVGEVFRTNAPFAINTFWRMERGGFARGRIFSRATGATALDRDNFSIQADTLDITFHTQQVPVVAGMGQERVRIVGVNRTLYPANPVTTYPVNAGNVGIGTQSPSTMLQIGGDAANTGGFRDWMDVGTLYQQGNDNMYVGFQAAANIQSNAVINWGNNPTNAGPDRLLFNFTAITGQLGNLQASTAQGLEAARMVTNGNRFFIGFGGDPLNPNQNAYTANPDPGNTVEINSVATVVGPANSGLRFTDLNSTSNTITNPGQGVLSVNAIGDVIYVPGGGGGVGTCAAPTTFVSGANGAIDLQDVNNFYFIRNGVANKNNVGVGHPCNYNVPAKLSVIQTGYTIQTLPYPFLFMGGDFVATPNTPQPNMLCVGVRGHASSISPNNIGVWGSIIGSASSFNPTAINVAGLFEGDVFCTANATFPTWSSISDSSLKHNISSFNSGIELLRNIHPKSYKYNGKLNIDTTRTYFGLIAEDLQLIAPFAVDSFSARLDSTDIEATTLLSVRNDAIIYTTVNAIKQLDSAVTKINSVPDAPVLISPANEAVLDTNAILFTWNSSLGSVSSEFQVSHMSDFSSLIASSSTVISDINSFSLNSRQDTDPFYWRVRMRNGAGVGTWSEVRSVTLIHTPPPAPVLISPADGIAGNFCGTQQFTWHKIPQSSAHYYLELARDAAFENIVRTSAEVVDTTTSIIISLGQSEVFDFNFSIPLQPDTDTGLYFWRVRAVYNGVTGPHSQAFSFNNNALCGGGGNFIGFDVATGFGSESDSRFKTNVTPITSALDKLTQLNGVSYDWIQTPGYEFDSTRQIGFIAQDVQAVVPEIVRPDANGYLTLDYGRLVPVLVEAIKSLKNQVDSLSNANIRTTGSKIMPSTDVELASKSSVLWQNFPNPFGDGTVIRYFVPEQTASANIVFYDEFGNEVKTTELLHRGQKAELNLSTMNLAAGIYSYSLIVDGKIVDTKRMVKTK